MREEFDREIREALQGEPIPVPEEVVLRTEEVLASLPDRAPPAKRPVLSRAAAIAACFLFLLLAVLPNVSPAYAQAMEQVPVLGKLVRVLTIRNYFYSDGSRELDAQIPEIHDPDHPLPNDLINQDVDALAREVIQQFYRDMEAHGGQNYGSLQVDYDVVTNTADWFTLKLTVHETAAGSNTYAKFYHIDRRAGTYVTFGSLFHESDYPAIQKLILEQMRAHMARDGDAAYWTEGSDHGQEIVYLHPAQNFYFNSDGELVIVYNAYEVAPGYMGCPEFAIPADLYRPLL